MWQRVVDAALSVSRDGFQANLEIVNDRVFATADPINLAVAAGGGSDHALLVIADARTMLEAEMPLLCVDLVPFGRQFRVRPDELWSVENNISLANMDFAEFADAVDPDGVFRGFPE
jgi:hypothetical protein